MINFLIGLIIGILLGSIGGYFVYRNNKKKIDDAQVKYQQAKKVISELKKI